MNLLYQEFIGNLEIDRKINYDKHYDCHFCQDSYCKLNHEYVMGDNECCNDFFIPKNKSGMIYNDNEYQLQIIKGKEPFIVNYYICKNDKKVKVRKSDSIRIIQILNNDGRINKCLVLNSERRLIEKIKKELI